MEIFKNYNRVCSIESIIASVWNGRIASNESLNRCVSTLRKKLGADAHCIFTHHGHGYRFYVPGERAPEPSSAMKNADSVYAVIAQGRELIGFRNAHNLDAARQFIRNWVAANEPCADGCAFTAEIETMRAIRGFIDPLSAARMGVHSAGMALKLRPGHPLATAIKGWFEAVSLGVASRAEQIDHAIVASPHDPRLRVYRALAYAVEGDLQAGLTALSSIENFGRSGAIPSGAVLRTALLSLSGEIEEASKSIRANMTMFPWDPAAFFVSSIIESAIGNFEEALRHAKIADKINGGGGFLHHNVAYMTSCAFGKDAASEAFNDFDATLEYAPISSLSVPAVLALRGEEQAQAFLMTAIARGCPNRFMIKFDSRFADLYRRTENLMQAGGA